MRKVPRPRTEIYAAWLIASLMATKTAIILINQGSTASMSRQPHAAIRSEKLRPTAAAEAFVGAKHQSQPPGEDQAHPPGEPPSTIIENIEAYSRLRAKALRTSDEDQMFRRFRSDSSIVTDALNEIRKRLDSPDTRSESSDVAQLGAITLVQDALLDPAYPDRNRLQILVEQTILADNLDASLSRPVLRRLASDKGELVLGYISARPERIDFIKAASAGSVNRRVIDNALSIINRAPNAK